MRPLLAAAASLSLALGFANAETPAPDASPPKKFVFSSGVGEIDAAYALALWEMSAAEHGEGGHFLAGHGWQGLWTRDTSYAVELAAGLVHPGIAEASLRKCARDGVWMQDSCMHFGGWPNLSDAIVGARGAWALYLVTGDAEFLRWAYGVTKNSLDRAEEEAYDVESGLFRGCSSFMESNSGYPDKYRDNGRLVGKTKALSTNLLYHSGYALGAKMGKIVGAGEDEIEELLVKGRKLRDAIRTRLWREGLGNYAYFEDEDGRLVEQNEGLGVGLLLTDPDFSEDDARVRDIFNTTHRTPRGLPCLWPPFEHARRPVSMFDDYAVFDRYHNGRIWPFVQGYWAAAAATHGRADVFAEEFRNLLSLCMSPDPTFAEFYELDGSFPDDRKRQLWSDAGFLGMIYRGLFGMTFRPDGIAFDPVKPHGLFGETVTLKNVLYRNMTIDVSVSGSGTRIASFAIDNRHVVLSDTGAFIRSDLQGEHKISIVLNDNEVDFEVDGAQNDNGVNVAQHPVYRKDWKDAGDVFSIHWPYYLVRVYLVLLVLAAFIPCLLFWKSWSIICSLFCMPGGAKWNKKTIHRRRGQSDVR